MSGSATTVAVRVAGRVAEIVLVPPEGKPPTLDHRVLDRLEEAIAEVESCATTLRVVVIRSASPKYFCVGADVGALRDLTVATIPAWIEHGHHVFNRLEDLPIPVVARVEGFALGGGLELAMAADVIVASAESRLGQPEAGLGFVAGWGGTWRLVARVGVGCAKELLFTGRTVTGSDAASLGLVDIVAEPEKIDARCREFFIGVERGAAVAIREMKRIVNMGRAAARTQALRLEAEASQVCLSEPEIAERVATFLAQKKATK